MARYIVSCTLTSPGRDYVALSEAAAGLGDLWPCTPAIWLLTSTHSAAEIRDALKPHLGAMDEILVAELTGRAAWRGADGHFSEGLKRVFAEQRHT